MAQVMHIVEVQFSIVLDDASLRQELERLSEQLQLNYDEGDMPDGEWRIMSVGPAMEQYAFAFRDTKDIPGYPPREKAVDILARTGEYMSPNWDAEEMGRTMTLHNLSEEAWDSIPYSAQAALIDAAMGD